MCVCVCVCVCLQLLWNYKLNLTTDPKFESVAVEVCKTTITEVSPSNRVLTAERLLFLSAFRKL